MERTLGEIARETWLLVDNNPIDWQAVADAVVAEYERRRWRAIESAPKDGTPMYAWFNGLGFATEVKYQPYDTYSDYVSLWDHQPMSENPTHWTPIPVPPKEASDDN